VRAEPIDAQGMPNVTVLDVRMDPAVLARPIVNITTTLEGADSDYYRWEITATKRAARRWSLQASFAQTWRQGEVAYDARRSTGRFF
jgi:hypothetical protein